MQITISYDVLSDDLFRLLIGEMLVIVGQFAILLHRLRSRTTDRSTLYFGLASFLYGLRLIVEMEVLQTAFPRFPWQTVHSSITLVVAFPFVAYFGSTIGRKYPWFTRGFLAALVLVGLDGAVRLILGLPMDQVGFLNSVVIVVIFLGWIYIAIFPRIPIDREVNTLRFGLGVMALGVIYQNLWGLGFLPEARFVEPTGTIFLLGSFLSVSARRSLRMEADLTAIRNELDIARKIQAQLLPELNGAMAGVEIHARYSPAGSVAGDFYDVLSDGRGLGVLIADVSGHGVPAALSASTLKVALRAQAEQIAHPAEVLTELNRTLCGLLRDQFITAAYVYFDPAGRELRYAGAGHPPILLWRAATKKVESLEENGMFLGPFPWAKYTERRAPFEPGDRCLLYTDGVLEASNRREEEFGAARLSEFLARHSGEPADAACSALLDQVTAWSGEEPDSRQDDITFVAVELPPAAPIPSTAPS